MPENLSSCRFQYADETALVVQSTDFKTCEDKLNKDLATLLEYYKTWKLKPNPSKTELIMFHLNNKLANQKLKMAPKYLGVNLDPGPIINVQSSPRENSSETIDSK